MKTAKLLILLATFLVVNVSVKAIEPDKGLEYPEYSPSGDDLRIGYYPDGPGRPEIEKLQYFKGSIDDVRIYNRALSAEEVKALYDLEKPKTK